MNQNLINELYRIVGKQNLKIEEPMAKHTTFRIGGPAQYLVAPQNVEELGLIAPSLRLELREQLRAYYHAHPEAMEPHPSSIPLNPITIAEAH